MYVACLPAMTLPTPSINHVQKGFSKRDFWNAVDSLRTFNCNYCNHVSTLSRALPTYALVASNALLVNSNLNEILIFSR